MQVFIEASTNTAYKILYTISLNPDTVITDYKANIDKRNIFHQPTKSKKRIYENIR